MRNFIYLGALVVLFASCEKNDPTKVIETKDSANFFPMEIGNYWVYEVYIIDTSGRAEKMGVVDSTIIVGDTLIKNEKYFVFHDFWGSRGSKLTRRVLRDSLGYIVDDRGTIQMAYGDVDNPVRSFILPSEEYQILDVSYNLKNNNEFLMVPAGTFKVIDFEGTVNYLQEHSISSIYPRYTHDYLAPDIGLVMNTYFYAHSPIYYEERLVRYSIN